MSCWYVYLLRCADDTLYCGVTTDPKRRLSEHNSGKGAKYTRCRLPVQLEVTTTVPDRRSALRLEYRIKQLPRHQKIDFLKAYIPETDSEARGNTNLAKTPPVG